MTDTTTKWLKAGSLLVIGFGLLFLSATVPATAGPALAILDLITWPMAGVDGSTTEFRLISGIGAGIMVGWGVMLYLLSGEGMREAPAFSRRAILISIWTWFIVDGLGSLAAGAPLNAVLNLTFLLWFTLPLRARAMVAAG